MKGVHPIVSLQNVGVCFSQRAGFLKSRKFWALEDVSLNLFQGETLGVVGNNGAGKTTLLKVLSGILEPSTGTYVNPGFRASMLTLQLGFLPNLTGRDNAVLSGMFLGLARKAVLQKLDAIMEFSELGEFFDQPVRTYSAGMRARLGFSVALEASPDILLIDEVLGVGDASFRAKSTAALKSLIRSERTVVLVSHNPATLRELCDRLVWIESRVSRMEGPVDEVMECYQASMHSPVGRTVAAGVEAQPSGRPALFLHIPKTAGTSIVDIAAPYYGEGLISHGDYHGCPPSDFRNVPFVSGHFGYSYARPLMDGRVSFTFLREPRERVLSYYYFCRSRDPQEWPVYALAQQLTLVEFLRLAFSDGNVKSAIWNGQVWQLAHGWANLDRRNITLWEPAELLELAIRHLDEFDHVGLTETFQQDQDVILDLLEIPRPEVSVTSNRTENRPRVAELEPAVQEVLTELTELDQVLYDEVCARRAVPEVRSEPEGTTR